MPGLRSDLSHGIRQLATSPGFTTVAVLSLALGIGANTAIFQLLNAVRLRSLPVRNPHELVEIKIVGGNRGMGLVDSYDDLTRPIWEEIRRSHPAFSGVLAWSSDQVWVGEPADRQYLNVTTVSGEFFGVLGVQPYRGRLVSADDEHACPESVAVVGYNYWRNTMGGREIDAHTTLIVDGQRRQVVGVTPPSFFGLDVGSRFDVAVPFCRPKQLARNVFDVSVFGRLRPGWTPASASAELAAASPAIMAATEITGYDPGMARFYRAYRLGAYPAPAGISELRKVYDRPLWLLLAVTGLVLLIACSNLANLMLARAATREREMAVRLALGAGRARLLGQLLTESGFLAVAGAALGAGLANFLSRALVLILSTEENPVSLVTGTDWRVLLFTTAVAGLTTLACGLVPALRASAVDPITAINAAGRANTTGRGSFSMQRILVIAQISVSLVLLVGALLFVRSFRKLVTFDPGMREQGIAVAYIDFRKSNVPRERILQFQRELLDEVRSTPGVLSAATTTHVPLVGGSWTHTVTIGKAEGSPRFTWVSPGYFQTMGIPITSGRDFLATDTASSQHVAIVNQAFVRSLLNGANPLGLTMRTHPEPDYPATDYQIVAVIPDTKYNDLRGDTPPMTFAPQSQFPNPEPFTPIMIRSATPPAVMINVLKRAMAAKHPEVVPTFAVFERQVRDQLVLERLMATLAGFFGALAALLGMIGLYGVVSYMVGRRRNEIGIRVALGASRGQVVGMVMRQAGLLLAVGVAIGTALALAAARTAESMLFGLKSNDPPTFVAAAALLAAIGAIGSLFPARRAAKLDPMTALRCD
jgi:putative ABC transport system permease protein